MLPPGSNRLGVRVLGARILANHHASHSTLCSSWQAQHALQLLAGARPSLKAAEHGVGGTENSKAMQSYADARLNYPSCSPQKHGSPSKTLNLAWRAALLSDQVRNSRQPQGGRKGSSSDELPRSNSQTPLQRVRGVIQGISSKQLIRYPSAEAAEAEVGENETVWHGGKPRLMIVLCACKHCRPRWAAPSHGSRRRLWDAR